MKLFQSYKRIHKRLLLAEVVMLLASVFIFRGLWTLLDRVSFMHTSFALWLSVIIGLVLTTLCLRYVLKHGK